MRYTGNYSGIALEITKEIALMGSHSGPCDADIEAIRRNIPKIERQLKKLNPDELKKKLEEYGAWNENELKNHDENLNRILWIACGDIRENLNSKKGN